MEPTTAASRDPLGELVDPEPLHRGWERNPSISGPQQRKAFPPPATEGLEPESCSLEAVLQLLAAHLPKGTLYSFLCSRFSCSVSKTRFSFAATSSFAL